MSKLLEATSYSWCLQSTANWFRMVARRAQNWNTSKAHLFL